uniref:ADNP homeobox 2 n=1 Tax=Callorhinchus milii TaxID=7868 RepID=A0A4W3J402_CALMI
MYQLPVTKLDTIRKSRKKVKGILSDIGLDCLECNMNITSWTDISVWQPSKKLEVGFNYRTKPYCCSLCAFSTTFISAYKSHMRCSHEDEMDVEMMIGCPNCPFVSYPKNMKKHIRMFHSEPRKAHVTNINTDQVSPVQPKILQGKMSNLVKPVYFCRVCHYKNVSMYALKKHVFLSHFGTLVNAYIGEVEPKLVSKDKIPYFCKGCKIKMITYEALIYHILDRHKKVDHQVKAVIGHVSELRTVPPIAPKPLMDQASVAALPSAGPSVQPFKAPPIVRPPDQTQPSVGPPVPLVQTPSSVRPPTPSVQALPITGPPVPLVQAINMMALKPVTVGSFLPNVNHFPSQNNTIPVTISTTGPVGAPNATQVNLLSAFQNNLTIRTVGPFSLPVSSAGMTGGTPGMNSTVQVPMTVTQTNAMTSVSPQQIKEPSPEMTFAFPPVQEQQSEDCVNPPKTQQWKSCSECSELVPLNLFDSHVAVAHNAEKISNKPDKVVASASYLQRVRAQIGKCLFCKSYVHKNVLLSHLLTHGLSCLFCALTFHDLAQLAEHMKSLHAGLKFESVHYIKDGVPTSSQINGGSFNMTITLPEDKMGPNDIHLTLIPNKMSSPHAPLLIEICREKNEATIVKNTPTEEKPDIKCSFCSKLILESKYEKHLHENHQVAPMIHPLLKIPAFKCIHCLGVYTDSMTASTISLHLLHCRGLNKQPILPKSVVQSKREVPDIEKNYTTEILNTESEDLELPPSKRLKVDVGASNHQLSPTSVIDTDPNSQSLPLPDPSTVLALVPKDFENCSYEERKLFLLDYFHKRPYPSNEEVEMLSSILWLWKADVALMFSKKQHLCLRAIKRRKPLVLLGFNMSEMRNVKHSITLGEI